MIVPRIRFGKIAKSSVGFAALALSLGALSVSPQSTVGTVTVDATPAHEVNAFEPDKAVGSSIDVLSATGIDEVYTPDVMKEMLSAGYGTITFRNNSELRGLAWHWNPDGAWSDSANQSGYFTGSTDLRDPIRAILSYSLPHRGFTGSNGGSVIDDGDIATYWKSNPYLAQKFSGDPDSQHPQWVVIDLKNPTPVNGMRIAWADPYAVSYEIDYWVPAANASREGEDPLSREPNGAWQVFPYGKPIGPPGGTIQKKLSDAPVTARYLRVWMTESSNTCDTHGSSDPRNCVGYAINEIYAGALDANGNLSDAIHHSADNKQTNITVSSVDPWHRAEDVVAGGRAQHTGLDLFFTGGITKGLPAMIPVTVLYGTPDDAAAEIAYVEKRGYSVSYVEMGEEPDGQKIRPEDYAALYVQWAKAIHKVDPKVKLGGPVFEGVNEDIAVWPDAQGRTSWSGRFVDYLRTHNALSDLTFWSFEHYPLEPCGTTWTDLYKEPDMMRHVMRSFRENGVPKNVPLIVDESSISWRLTGPMSQLYGALWLSDSIGSFLAEGGAEYHHSPIQPQNVQNSCAGPATWSNFVPGAHLHVTGYTSFYFAARLINLEWLQHGAGIHHMFLSSANILDDAKNVLVTSYAVKRPDGTWSLLLVNRDQNNPHPVRVTIASESGGSESHFTGDVKVVSFGSEQYVWQDSGHADPDGPAVAAQVAANAQTVFSLPKASVTVISGKVTGSR
jgi:hypothetical protein